MKPCPKVSDRVRKFNFGSGGPGIVYTEYEGYGPISKVCSFVRGVMGAESGGSGPSPKVRISSQACFADSPKVGPKDPDQIAKLMNRASRAPPLGFT